MISEPETSDGKPRWRRLVALTFIVQLCSMMGVSVMFSFLPLYIETLGVGSEEQAAFWAGVMMFSQAIMVYLLVPSSSAARISEVMVRLPICSAF